MMNDMHFVRGRPLRDNVKAEVIGHISSKFVVLELLEVPLGGIENQNGMPTYSGPSCQLFSIEYYQLEQWYLQSKPESVNPSRATGR